MVLGRIGLTGASGMLGRHINYALSSVGADVIAVSRYSGNGAGGWDLTNWLSNEEFDKIKFFNDKYQTIKIEIKDWNLWNAESWWFSVKTGDVILFPSSLTHMVENKEGTNTRISLAFNVFIKGTVGNNKNLTELIL